MKLNQVVLSSIALIAMSVSVANAGRMYADIGAGSNAAFVAAASSEKNTAQVESGGLALNGDVGYAFNDHHGVELGAMHSSLTQKDDNDKTRTISTTIPYAAYRYDTAIYKKIHFIGKLGLMVPNKNLSSSSDFDKDDKDDKKNEWMVLPMDAVGLGYKINDNLEADVMYQGVILGIANAGQATAGLNYRF